MPSGSAIGQAWFAVWLLAAALVAAAATAFLGPSAAVAVVLLAVAYYWLSMRPTITAFVMVALIPVTSGLRRGLPVPGLRLSEVLTVALAAIVLLASDHRRRTRWTPIEWMLALYALAAFLLGLRARVVAGEPITQYDIGQLIGPTQYFLFARAISLALQTSAQRLLAIRVVVVASLPVSVLGILQPLVPPLDSTLKQITGFSAAATGGSPGAFERVNGLFPHFQPFSAYLFVVIITGFSLLLFAGLRGRPRAVVVVALVAAGVALVRTLTISSMLVAAAGVVLLALWSPDRKKYLSAIAAVLVVLAVAFSGSLTARADSQRSSGSQVRSGASTFVPETIAFRWDVWTKQSLPVLRGNELLGLGPTLPTAVFWRNTESQYLDLLFNGGIVLLGVFAALWVTTMRAAARAARAPDATARSIGRALLVMTGLLVLTCFIQPYMTYGGISHVVWGLAALAGTAARAPHAGRSAVWSTGARRVAYG